jgi:hypothetical protein
MNQPTETGAAARLLVDQMQRERRSFWGILGVFFLLLTGIGGMIVYQMLELKTFAEDARAQRFQEIGEQSLALSELRSQQNDGAVAQREAVNQRVEAQRTTDVAYRALRASPDSLVKSAETYAKQHFLGRTLNQSSATVITGALDSRRLTSGQRALLRAAIDDWNMPNTMPEADLAAAWPKVEANSKALIADRKLRYFGYAARAAYRFRQANSGAVYMDWENGCKELIDETTSALRAENPAANEGVSPDAAGLNLHYWRGQCWRRHGEPEKARAEFELMMRLAGSDRLPATNPLKFQAYHGMGTVMTTLLDEGQKSPEQRNKEVADAMSYLVNAGEFRVQSGMTEVGRVNSTGNIGFLLLKENTQEGLVKTLEHAGAVDEVHTSTWNLVAELVAARALKQKGLPSDFSDASLKEKAAGLREKYSPEALDEIIFRTLAKLAYQQKSSLPKRELSKILDASHHPVLEEADACIEQRLACYRRTYRAS